MSQTKTKDSSKFKLTEDEVKNLKGREMSIDYIIDLIKRDIRMYIQFDVMKRLNIEPNQPFQLSEDREWLELLPKEEKIITNSNGKV